MNASTRQRAAPQAVPHPVTLWHMLVVLAIGAAVCLAGAYLFLQLASAVLADTFLTLDERVLLGAHTVANPALGAVMYALTTIGSPTAVMIQATLVAAALAWRSRRVDALGVLAAVGGALLLNLILTDIYARVRPALFDGPIHLTTYSFPSGHAMGSIACYGMLAFIAIRLARQPWQRVLVGVLAVALVAGVALSRVYFGVHFPTDILGGLLAGAIWLTAVIVMLQLASWEFERRLH
jgi:undecaprenyl-diphosphatase